MVVRNGIILIDYARILRGKNSMPVHEAALAAGKRRMRPIFLTSAAAAVGVIPMIMSGSLLWGPLGTVICFGLLISMVLTLYILPILYSLVYTDKTEKKNGFWSLPKSVVIGFLIISLPLLSNKAEAQTLSLDSCKQLALKNNQKIRQAEFDVKGAEEQRKSAFTNYFPIVSASALTMRSSDYLVKGKIPNIPIFSDATSTGAPIGYTPAMPINMLDYVNTANISVSMPLYVGGRIRNGNKLAVLGEDVSRKQQLLTTTEVLVHTEELYWTVISLREKQKTITSYQALLDTLCRDVNNFQRAGLAQRNDLLKVQLKQNELKVNLMRLNNGIELTTMALCQHIGLSYDTTLVFETQPVTPITMPELVDAQNAVTNRVEYQLLNRAIEAEELQRKMTIGEYMPQLSVSALGAYIDVANSSKNNGLALVTLSIPISDWWGGSHKIKQQRMKIEKAKSNLSETAELLVLQVEQANKELHESWFQVQVSKKSVEQACENLKVTEDNYHVGTVGVSDLLEAQAISQGAKDNLTDAQCNYQIKMAKYLKAINSYK